MDSSRVDYDLMTLTDTIIKLNSKLPPPPQLLSSEAKYVPPPPAQ